MEYKRLGGGGYVRNVAHAEITIYRFERGKYVEIAKYFNANNTFTWTQEKSTNGGLSKEDNKNLFIMLLAVG